MAFRTPTVTSDTLNTVFVDFHARDASANSFRADKIILPAMAFVRFAGQFQSLIKCGQ